MFSRKRIVLLIAAVALVLAGADVLTPPGPPRSTLSFGGETQIGKLGPSCWVEKRWLGPSGACASAASEVPQVPAAPISGPAGSKMTFAFGGKSIPAEVQAIAYPFEPGKRPNDRERGERRRTFLPTRPSDDGAEIAAEVPPGEYSVRVAVTVPRNDEVLTGEAVYGFHVVVE